MTAQRKLLVIAVIILIVAVVISLFVYLNSPKSYVGNVASVTLGLYPSEYSSLVYIAKDQKYFSANGLEITFRNYSSGAAAARGMLSGEVDISTASEFVVANNAMQGASLYAFGSVSKYLNLFMVARTDKEINSVSDLSGKKIGVALGSSNEFYLGRYLDLNGLKLSQVTLVDVNFAQTPKTLANGTLDAAIMFQPYINQIRSLLGKRVVIWPAQADQFGYFEAVCTRNWATAHSDLIVRFLKALVQAESLNINHQNQAIALLAKDLNYTNSYTASVWQDYQYSVTLDQGFILLMQDEARWLISNNLTNATSIPNFVDYVYVDGLKSARPESVNIIGVGD